MQDRDLSEKPSSLSRETFLRVYGGIYENAPWVAETVYDDTDVGNIDTVGTLFAAMRLAVDMADRGTKLSLLRAHPDLAVGAAQMAKMGSASIEEQQGAGLDHCTTEEFSEFERLNREYKEKFGFPFIVAVKGMMRGDILNAFRQRSMNDADAEFEAALLQVHKIARFRIEKLA